MLTASFAASTEGSDIDAIVSAVFIASSTRLASGTMRATRPARSASCTSIIRPVSIDVHRLGLADGARETLRAADAGNDPEPDFGLAEFGVVGGDDEIALHRQFAAAAEREAGHRRDHRLAYCRGAIPVGGEIAEKGLVEGLVGHFLDVGAGGKRLVRAGDHHAADGGVRLECVERLRRDRAPARG